MQKSGAEERAEHIAVTYLVVGGGIAGVTCAEHIAICCPTERILLITESNVVKTVVNLQPVARYVYKFDIEERAVGSTMAPSIMTLVDQLQSIEATAKRIRTRQGRTIAYKYLCLCTGGLPKLIAADNSRVLGIRDTDSVLELQRRLQGARRILLLGNGGIASELAHELRNVEVHWVVKDKHITASFVDPGAAHFFQQSRLQRDVTATTAAGPVKRMQYSELCAESFGGEMSTTKQQGAALGPDWQRNFNLSGSSQVAVAAPILHYECQVADIRTHTDGILVTLSNGETLECDFLVSATGVEPRHEYACDAAFSLAPDGGILVDELMATNVPHIYAAGDVCTTSNWTPKDHWFQMRLWTQARQMGAMAGRSMAAAQQGDVIYPDFCFELFGHVTKLFGYEVVLLGRYNGQDLGTDYEILLRSTPGKEYIKLVLQRGRLRGALLIGNSELAETCENLILNGIDLTPFGDDILNPDIDIEDYFD